MAKEYNFRNDPRSNHPMPTKSSSGDSKTKVSGPLRSIRIECAENGYSVRCDHAPVPGKSSSDSMVYTPDKEYVFESADAVLRFVKGKLE